MSEEGPQHESEIRGSLAVGSSSGSTRGLAAEAVLDLRPPTGTPSIEYTFHIHNTARPLDQLEAVDGRFFAHTNKTSPSFQRASQHESFLVPDARCHSVEASRISEFCKCKKLKIDYKGYDRLSDSCRKLREEWNISWGKLRSRMVLEYIPFIHTKSTSWFLRMKQDGRLQRLFREEEEPRFKIAQHCCKFRHWVTNSSQEKTLKIEFVHPKEESAASSSLGENASLQPERITNNEVVDKVATDRNYRTRMSYSLTDANVSLSIELKKPDLNLTWTEAEEESHINCVGKGTSPLYGNQKSTALVRMDKRPSQEEESFKLKYNSRKIESKYTFHQEVTPALRPEMTRNPTRHIRGVEAPEKVKIRKTEKSSNYFTLMDTKEASSIKRKKPNGILTRLLVREEEPHIKCVRNGTKSKPWIGNPTSQQDYRFKISNSHQESASTRRWKQTAVPKPELTSNSTRLSAAAKNTSVWINQHFGAGRTDETMENAKSLDAKLEMHLTWPVPDRVSRITCVKSGTNSRRGIEKPFCSIQANKSTPMQGHNMKTESTVHRKDAVATSVRRKNAGFQSDKTQKGNRRSSIEEKLTCSVIDQDYAAKENSKPSTSKTKSSSKVNEGFGDQSSLDFFAPAKELKAETDSEEELPDI